MGWKIALCKWHTFWMVPCLICYFFCHVVLYWEKLSFYEKFSRSLTLEIQIVWKIVQKFQLKWKIVNYFASFKQRTAWTELFSLPPFHPTPNKTWLRLWNKNLFKEIYRNIQTYAFKVLQECSSRKSRNGLVQIFFLSPNRNMFSGKFVKSERFLAVLREHIIFNVKRVEVRKMRGFFEQNCIVKCVIFSC